MDVYDQWVLKVFEQKNNEIIRNVINRPLIPKRLLTDYIREILATGLELIKTK